MPDDELLERELGDRIRAYAASGDRPVDPAAVASRAMGSGRQPSGGWGGRFTTVLGAAAGILVVLVTLSIGVLVASGGLGSRGSVGATPPPSAVASVPVAASASPSETASPSDSAAPTLAPPSETPSLATPTPVATTAVPASPSATPSPSPSPDGTPVAAGFAPRSVTFVSPSDGFVLGAVPCASGSCVAIARTANAGRTWSMIPAPATTLSVPSPDGAPSAAGVSTIRFADPSNGWVFGPELWSTHDGGTTWARVAAGASPGRPVVALEVARGTVHVAVTDTDGFALLTGAVGSDELRATDIKLPFGAGPVPELQLVLSGDAGWVLQNDRTVVNGARLRNGTWADWSPVCADVVGPAYLAASSASDLVAACDVGLWGDPKGGHLYVSTDGGSTAAEAGTKVPVALGGAIASGRADTVVVSGTTPDETVLEATFDGGRTWSEVLKLGNAEAVDLGFTTADQGVVVAVDPSGTSRFFMTRDGGHTWEATAF
jgi:photosystem II stability/assembly factor-like uncharacterized protein